MTPQTFRRLFQSSKCTENLTAQVWINNLLRLKLSARRIRKSQNGSQGWKEEDNWGMCTRSSPNGTSLPTWLADKEADVVSEDRSVPVQEVAGQLHHDRQLGQLLQDLTGLGKQQSSAQHHSVRTRKSSWRAENVAAHKPHTCVHKRHVSIMCIDTKEEKAFG